MDPAVEQWWRHAVVYEVYSRSAAFRLSTAWDADTLEELARDESQGQER